MKDKELRKLSRQELLELLIEQTKRADELQERINLLEEQLDQRDLTINNAGSLAEAARRINKVFEAADRAVAQYIESVKKLGEEAYMPELPKAASNESLSDILDEFTKRNNLPKPQLKTFRQEKNTEKSTEKAEEETAPQIEKKASAKQIEVKRLKY